MKAKFRHGDKLRRKVDGRLLTVRSIEEDTYNFTDGTFALIADQECYDIVEKASGYFVVATSVTEKLLKEHLKCGYEDRQVFKSSLNRIINRFGGRIGKMSEDRNGFLHLVFNDTPGRTEQTWIPVYLLSPIGEAEQTTEEDDKIIKELDEAFGFT